MWAPRLGLDRCQECGTAERPHASGGYCNRCLKRRQYQGRPTRSERAETPLGDVSDVTWAYIAGILDGEGTITADPPGVSPSGRPHAGRPTIIVYQTHFGLIAWLHRTLGGTTWVRREVTVAHKPIYGWRVSGRRTVPILQAVLPYLRVKDRQAELVIEFAKVRTVPFTRLDAAGQERQVALTQQIRALNHRGR